MGLGSQRFILDRATKHAHTHTHTHTHNFPLLLKNHLLLKLAEELLVAISFQLAMYLSTLYRHSLN